MGGAFVARASDPSAIYYNPAGLAFQNGINVMGGATLIFPSTTFKPTNEPGFDVSQKVQVFYPPNLYGTYALNDQWVVGLGVFSPYGLGSEWDRGWLGNESAIKTSIQTFYFNPSISYKINNDLSLGIGISYVYATVFMSTNPSGGGSASRMELDGSGKGFNVNAGIMWKPIEKLSVGASYRMKTDIEFSGDVKITGMGADSVLYPGGTGKATFPMPGNLTVGAAYEVIPGLTVEGDIQYVQWPAYYQLKVDITPVVAGGQGTKQPSIKNWDYGYIGRIGAEYRANQDLTIRGGFVYDVTPQPIAVMEPMLPDADRMEISFGTGYKINEKVSVDFAYMLVLFADRTSTYRAPVALHPDMSGTYSSTAHLFGFDVSYTF
jgi:long-chain fatty acid transport protein